MNSRPLRPERSAHTRLRYAPNEIIDNRFPQLLLVKVIPKARKEEVVGFRGEELVVKVSVAPEKGKANIRVIELLSGWFNVSPSQIELVQGAASPHKKFRIEPE